jgi:hypothetical protein
MSLYAGIWNFLAEVVIENYPVFVVIVSEQWKVTK